MIFPRPIPFESCRTMSKASISGWAARKLSASSTVEPEGDWVIGISGEKLGQHFVERGDQPIDLTLCGGGADQHHVVKRRDQAAAVQERDMDGALDLRLMGEGG